MKKLLLLFVCLLTVGSGSLYAAEQTVTLTVKGATVTLSNNNTAKFGDANVTGGRMPHSNQLISEPSLLL